MASIRRGIKHRSLRLYNGHFLASALLIEPSSLPPNHFIFAITDLLFKLPWKPYVNVDSFSRTIFRDEENLEDWRSVI